MSITKAPWLLILKLTGGQIKSVWTNAEEINPQNPVFWASLAWLSASVLYWLSCFAAFSQLISNSTFKKQYVIWDKGNTWENVVVLSYKPRADVPTLIPLKVLLEQIISIPAQKGGIRIKNILQVT